MLFSYIVGDLIAFVIVRQLQPSCSLDENWCVENLLKETKRAVEALYTFVTTRNVPLLMTYSEKKLLSSLAFCYCLPLIRMVLEERGIRINGEEKLRTEALQLILLHSRQRAMFDSHFDTQVSLFMYYGI